MNYETIVTFLNSQNKLNNQHCPYYHGYVTARALQQKKKQSLKYAQAKENRERKCISSVKDAHNNQNGKKVQKNIYETIQQELSVKKKQDLTMAFLFL